MYPHDKITHSSTHQEQNNECYSAFCAILSSLSIELDYHVNNNTSTANNDSI